MKKILAILSVLTLGIFAQNISKSLFINNTSCNIFNINKYVKISKNNSINLSSIIINTNLFTIKTNGLKLPTTKQIINAAKQLNPDTSIDWTKITVDQTLITTTKATLISIDQLIYTGNVSVKYTLDSSVALSSVIKNCNLGIIKTNGLKLPTTKQIINAAKQLNPDTSIDWTKITVDQKSITNTGAELISTDTTIYSGTISVTFTVVEFSNRCG